MTITKHIPNAITSMNLLSGAMGVICTFRGQMEWAFCLMLLAAAFDFCDGLAARLLKAYSPIGKELDSLSDMVSFGLLPSLMLVVTMDLCGCEGFYIYLPLFLAVMSALRLAKFNVDDRQESNFLGVPTPTAAIISGALACYVQMAPDAALAACAGTCWFLPLLALLLGLLLVSEIPMFGMKVKPGHKLLDAKRIIFLSAALVLLVTVLVLHSHFSLAFLLIFSFYVAENLVLSCVIRP